MVEETGVPEKITDLPHIYDIMLYRGHLVIIRLKRTASVVIGTDYRGSCKSNYDTIIATTYPDILSSTAVYDILLLGSTSDSPLLLDY